VSQLSFDADLLPKLEALYRTDDVLRRRRLVREALAPSPGERILDAGCGPGFYAAELLEVVGPRGSVTGVDRSPQMLAAARHRNEGHPNVHFFEGDVTSLPIGDESFDAALCVQVLEYVDDVERALGELNRVLVPGGRLVVWDVDWGTVSLSGSDQARTRRILDAWDGHLAHPTLPHMLSSLLRLRGFEDIWLEGHAFSANRLEEGTYLGAMLELVEQYVRGRHDVPDDDARAWVDDLRTLDRDGEFYLALIQVCARGRKPRGSPA
jgi:ubiquinone/menaquinone biosynthesis C-methylase UbiE